MYDSDRKLIVFKSDCDDEVIKGEKHFIKFLDDDKKHATIYLPAIAPRYLRCYIEENNYEVGYEILDADTLNKYESKVFTFTKENNEYRVTKGIELVRKRILLVDKGMNINLNLPKYNYEMTSDGFKINEIMGDGNQRSFCYVASEDEIDNDLKNIMLPVVEVMPGFLCINSYPFVPARTYKKKKRKKF